MNVKKGIRSLVTFYKTYKGIDTLFLEIFIGALSILGSLYIFLKLSHKIIEKEIIFFDRFLMDLMYDARSPFLTELMKIITFFGGELFIGTAIVAIIGLLLLTRHRKDAAIFAFILFFGIFLNLWLKGFFERLRPDELVLVIEKTYSFPSGHSMNSFIFFVSLSYFVFHNTRNKKLGLILSFLSVALVMLIGISRIYLGVHYPSDVLGGYAAGLLWFTGVLLFEKILIFLRLFREFELNKQY